MKNDSEHISKEDFQRYLTNQMSSAERNKFERLLQQNPFEYEALEGLSGQDPVVIADDLSILQSKVQNKKKKSNLLLRIAAVAMILITSGILLYTVNNNEVQKQVVDNRVPKEVKPEADEKTIDLSGEEKQIDEISENILKEEKSTSVKRITETPKTEKEVQVIETPVFQEAAKAYNVETVKKEEENKIQKTPPSLQNDKTLNIEPIAFNAQENRSKMSMDLLSLDSKKNKVETPVEIKPISGLARQVSLTSDEDSNQLLKVQGIVISKENNQPLPGVNIIAKGTTNGTITDLNGKFELQVPEDNENPFVATFIGMENNEFENTPDSENIIRMEESEMGLDEVVVIGYGVQRKRNLTGSTSRVETPKNSIKAAPHGGFKDYEKYLKDECIVDELSDKQKSVVKVKLSIDKTGLITKIAPLNKPDSLLLKRAEQIILDGPDWSPEIKNGVAVDSETTVRLRFKRK